MSATKRKREEPEPTAIEALPPETLTQVFEALDARSLGRAAQACRLWRALAYPIARPKRFRDPGFARIAVDDDAARVIVSHLDMFVGAPRGIIKTWDARGNHVISSAASLGHLVSLPGDNLGLRFCHCGDDLGRYESELVLANVATPFDLALTVEIVTNLEIQALIPESEVRVLTPEREVLFARPGRSFAVLGETLAIADGEKTTFWSCPK